MDSDSVFVGRPAVRHAHAARRSGLCLRDLTLRARARVPSMTSEQPNSPPTNLGSDQVASRQHSRLAADPRRSTIRTFVASLRWAAAELVRTVSVHQQCAALQGSLKDSLQENVDFVLLSWPSWRLLQRWYMMSFRSASVSAPLSVVYGAGTAVARLFPAV